MQNTSYISPTAGQSRNARSIAIGARLTTATSTIMTILLLASLGQGIFTTGLLAAAGLGFELLKWHSWQDAISCHYSHQHDRRNLFAALCAVAVALSIAASVATTRSNLSVSAGGYLAATAEKETLSTQIRQKQDAIDVCTAANRITLCAVPLQAEVSELQGQLSGLVIPEPDEATALILEVSSVSGLAFNDAATLVVLLISIMLDASGLYFLFKTTSDKSPVTRNAPDNRPKQPLNASYDQQFNGSDHNENQSEMVNQVNRVSEPADGEQQINLSVTLGVDETLRQALELISSGQVKPSIRQLSDSLDVPQHTAQTILHWLAEAGHLQKQGRGRGYAVNGGQGELI